jgi:drug/metabolite transporter (DMT)-like permease
MPNSTRIHRRSVAILLLTALLWGTTFPVIKDLVTSVSPALVISSRFVVAALAFLPFCRPLNSQLVREGSLLGLVAFVAYWMQVTALQTASANRIAFLTSLHVVIVPLLGGLWGRHITPRMGIAAFLACGGVLVMSWEPGGQISWGDLWGVGCAFCYAAHILLMEAVVRNHATLPFTAVQLITVALLGMIWAGPGSMQQLPILKVHWLTIAYLGLMTTALTTWTQTTGQRHLSATEAAIIYILEPVFAAIFAFWLLQEQVTHQTAVGAGLILVAMLLSQLGQPVKLHDS